MLYEQNENIYKELGNLQGNQKEIMELKSIIIEMNNPLQGFKGRVEQAEERMNKPEDRTMKINIYEELKEKG